MHNEKTPRVIHPLWVAQAPNRSSQFVDGWNAALVRALELGELAAGEQPPRFRKASWKAGWRNCMATLQSFGMFPRPSLVDRAPNTPATLPPCEEGLLDIPVYFEAQPTFWERLWGALR